VLKAPFHPEERAGRDGVLETEADFRREVKGGAAVGDPVGGKGDACATHKVRCPATPCPDVVLEQRGESSNMDGLMLEHGQIRQFGHNLKAAGEEVLLLGEDIAETRKERKLRCFTGRSREREAASELGP
jgi:hypothetical protein